MEKIIQIIGRNHADHISDQQTQAIAEVLLNKDFQF
jgi:hypothetical protein